MHVSVYEEIKSYLLDTEGKNFNTSTENFLERGI